MKTRKTTALIGPIPKATARRASTRPSWSSGAKNLVTCAHLESDSAEWLLRLSGGGGDTFVKKFSE